MAYRIACNYVRLSVPKFLARCLSKHKSSNHLTHNYYILFMATMVLQLRSYTLLCAFIEPVESRK